MALQIDNPVHYNARKEVNKARELLAKLKKREIESGNKPVFLKMGESREFKAVVRKITVDGVREMLKSGKSTNEIASHFKVSRQTVYHYKRKLKDLDR